MLTNTFIPDRFGSGIPREVLLLTRAWYSNQIADAYLTKPDPAIGSVALRRLYSCVRTPKRRGGQNLAESVFITPDTPLTEANVSKLGKPVVKSYISPLLQGGKRCYLC